MPTKRTYQTEDAKRKMREHHADVSGKNNPMFGKHHSAESIQKNKDNHLGKIPWNKGKRGVYSEETLKKLRVPHPSAIGKKPWNKGKVGIYHHTADTKKKIGDSRLGEKHYLFGNCMPHVTRIKIKNSTLGEKNHFYGKHHTEESKQKNREKHLGNHASDDTRRKMRLHWEDEKFAKRMIELFQIKPNGHELYLDFLLQNYFPDEWKFVGDGQVIINGLCPDFINVNGKKKIIELFGEHWHNGKTENRTEAGRKKIFNKHGYDLLVIWDYELKDESVVIEKIKEFEREG